MKGFTLLETIVAIFIFSLIIILIFIVIINFSNYYIFMILELVKQVEVDLALKELENELRAMVYSKKGSYPLEEVGPDKIIFYKDLTNDGVPERIHYFVEEKKLRKYVFLFNSTTLDYEQLPKIDKILVKDLSTSTIFRYLNKNLAETLNIADIRIIEANITSIIKFPNKIYKNSIIVVPRNLKEK